MPLLAFISRLATRHESLFSTRALLGLARGVGDAMQTVSTNMDNGALPTCGIAVMAKASIAGRTKTRLVPPLTFEEAARCNTAFLRSEEHTSELQSPCN